MASKISQWIHFVTDNEGGILAFLFLMAGVWFAGSYFRDRIRAHDEKSKEGGPLA